MTSSVAAAGEVSVEGEHLGRIEGFRFVPDTTEGQTDQKAVLSAALRALRQDLPARLQAFANSPDGELVFDSQLRICWGGGPVARLLPSGDILAPKVEALPSDLLDGPAREEVRKRAATWVETRIRLGLSELMDARATAELPAGARGIIFQLCEGLGVLARRPIEEQLAQLSEEDRKALARLGVRVGVYSLYFPSMLKPVPIRLRAGLWMVANNRETIPPLPAEGRTSMDLPQGARARFLRHHRLPAAGRPRHPRRHGRAPGGDGAPGRARKPRGGAARAAAAAKQKEARVPSRPATAAPRPPPRRPTKSANGRSSPRRLARASPRRPSPSPRPPPRSGGDAGRGRERAGAGRRSRRRGAGRRRSQDRRDRRPKRRPQRPSRKRRRRSSQRRSPTRPSADEAKMTGPRPLPPGWFRATPQMMSLVGCSEPEMANVLRGLGYRVHPPAEEHGPLYAFSVKPRFVREREEQRERQRQQQRQQRDQQRRERPERPERAAVLRRFAPS